MMRPPIPRTAAFEVRELRVAIELLAFAPDHHGHTDFAPLRVRYAEHGHFRHRRPAAGA